MGASDSKGTFPIGVIAIDRSVGSFCSQNQLLEALGLMLSQGKGGR